MTDRATENHATDGSADDQLVALYREAVAEDRGPSADSRERVLARAREMAARRAEAASVQAQKPRGEAANDRRWLRHALGSVAMIGLVGWLTLQHLDEPGAPQLDTAPVSAPAASAPMPEPPAQAPAEAEKKTNRAEDSMNSAVIPKPAPERVREKAAAKEERALREEAPAAASAAPELRRMPAPQSAPAPVPVPAPAPAPAAEVAPSAADSSAPAALSGAARRDSLSNNKVMRQGNAALKPLPICDADMDPEALAEQTRRIKARDEALAQSQPLPESAPICRPAKDEASPPGSESR
ncbi:hypothetical protein G7047_02285 [Diaphorobacter sp. HDW4A]|uniref:hypothetical protein n=1 Tax=Diaphorobacter sp. HDW4A TaxID=2714924 RepID=UPI0014082DFB|nr:hypothetical protein [Diaphorobacter sp. HDW4A]QIL78884.1 hypothetical protein G7047_02285 [Diaphorobacter sp. HDW4A]